MTTFGALAGAFAASTRHPQIYDGPGHARPH